MPLRGGQSTTVEQTRNAAELLVGKWKFVKSNATPPAEFQGPIEFTRDGNVIVGIENIVKDTPETHGVYRMEADTIWIFLEPPLRQNLGRRRVTIDSVTEERLVAVAWSGENKRDVYEFERVRGDAAGR
jgi:uncharacterized protein (TIGR03066 family)